MRIVSPPHTYWLEHVDEVLRSARLSGYCISEVWGLTPQHFPLIRKLSRVPGEPPPLDNAEVEDWLPRFVVLQAAYLRPQDSILLADIVEVYDSSAQALLNHSLVASYTQEMSSQICRSATRAARSLLSSSKNTRFFSEGRAIGAATLVYASGKVPQYASNFRQSGSTFASKSWITGLLALPTAAFMLQDQEVHAAEMERTFIAIKPDGVQRGLISEIITRFERKGFKLVGLKIMVPSKGFAQQHYHGAKERPFFNGLCDFISSGPVVAMVWEGEGVIRYGRKLIGATDPKKSEPGTIRGDLAVVVARNIIHGSDGPETAKDEISLWFKPEELVSYTNNAEKWIYGQN
ncbi:hypothetical protein DY000_02038099 [Brassica cretica]|uniref:Nucleoside diphosphate kinase n=1 Tax=Brassica cretica TaxID=69181 RepID=A0ABQ7BL24_BRACR|nr:hypothetical protein DY000_02038099 [Brassica cretica]